MKVTTPSTRIRTGASFNSAARLPTEDSRNPKTSGSTDLYRRRLTGDRVRLRLAALVLVCLLLPLPAAPRAETPQQASASSTAQADSKALRLDADVAAEGRLGGGAQQQYQFTLAENESAELRFRPGAFLCARVLRPDGQELSEGCHASSAWSLSLFAKEAGDYRLVLRQQYPAYAVAYQVTLERRRAAPVINSVSNVAAHVTSDRPENLAVQTARARSETDIFSKLSGAESYVREEVTADTARELIEKYERALAAVRAGGDRAGAARLLNNLGLIYADTSEYQKALDCYGEALLLRRALGDAAGEADTLNDMGIVYDLLGERQKALDRYEQALALRRTLKDRTGAAATLNNIGLIHNARGDYRRALDFYEQALPLWRTASDRAGEATTLNNIGLAYSGLGDQRQALAYYQQALPLWRELSNRRGVATTLNDIALAYTGLGEFDKAVSLFREVRTLKSGLGEPSREANTLFGFARAERERGDLRAARPLIEEAIRIAEGLRGKIVSRELRDAYFASVQGYYEFYIDLLMRLHRQSPTEGYEAQALSVNERARARGLLEILTEAGAEIRQGVDPALVDEARALQRRLDAAAGRQLRLLAARHTDEQAQAAARELGELETAYEEAQTRIRQSSPRYAALVQPAPLSAPELQAEVLDGDTLLLEYSLGAERSYLWAVTPDSLASYELPARAEIEELVRQTYALLSRPNAWGTNTAGAGRGLGDVPAGAPAAPEVIRRLSRLLLAPAAAHLGRKRLLVVADGALHFIPFAALTVAGGGQPYRPLAADHEIVSLPSASTLAVLRRESKGRKPAPKTLVVLADPVFGSDDERLKTKRTAAGALPDAAGARRGLMLELAEAAKGAGRADAGLQLPRLPGTRSEAEQILALAPAPARKQALDFAASRATATSVELGEYRYVHFATHGLLNSEHPELSGLVLSLYDNEGRPVDGFLRAHEVFNLRLSAEMVVLSACQTGLGKAVRGEGLVGLTRGFMYAGASRVVVSLWEVSDEATAELMKRFYRGLLQEDLRAPAALRAAQLSLMQDPKWRAPFYWAAFTLQGEWR